MWEVTMTRTNWSLKAGAQLALDPLVIDGNPHTGSFHLAEEDCSWPAFQVNRDYAPDSKDISGRIHRGAVIGEGSMGLRIAAHGSSFTETFAAMVELEECTSQFEYDLSLRVASVLIGTYRAKAELPLWGALHSGMVRASINEATISIPLNPGSA